MLKIGQTQRFGFLLIEKQSENHAVIYWENNLTPTFYELQFAKNIAFGGDANAIEIFPPTKLLVDGENQRHLWKVDYESIPHL